LWGRSPASLKTCSINTILKLNLFLKPRKKHLCQNVNSLHSNCSVKGIMCGIYTLIPGSTFTSDIWHTPPNKQVFLAPYSFPVLAAKV